MKECIRKFDKSLSLKANKILHISLMKEIKTDFISHEHWNGLEGKFGLLKKEIEKGSLVMDNNWV